MKPKICCIFMILLAASCSSPPRPVREDSIPDWIRETRIMRLEAILFEEHRDSYVRLLGQVKAPGLFKATGSEPLTLAALIKEAHGFDRMAYRRKVRVVREVDGREDVFDVDMREEADASGGGDFLLLPGDRVFVPEIMK